jgi:hypothetical protein
MMLDPIPELTSFSMSIGLFKLGDGELENELAAFKTKLRATKSSQTDAWPPIYRDALALFSRILAANERFKAASQPPPAAGGSGEDPRQLGLALSAAQSALQQAQGVWQGRLQSQVRTDLMPKIERSISSLGVENTRDRSTGMTVFKVVPAQLLQFYGWLRNLEEAWVANNAGLAAVRADEAVAEALGGSDVLGFRVSQPTVPLPAPCDERTPKLAGYSIPTPGPFELLGNTYKFIMSVVTAVSGLGFIASRAAGKTLVDSAIPYLLGGAFMAAVIVALVTVPTKRRQGLARIEKDATGKVQDQLRQAIEVRLGQMSADQINAIRRHLTSESARLGADVRRRIASEAPPPLAAPRAALGMAGIMPSDEEKLRGAWRVAVEARLAELGG